MNSGMMEIQSIQGTRDSVQLALPGQFAPEPGFEEALWRTAIPPGDPPPIGLTISLEELTIQSPNAESNATDPQTEIPLDEMAMAMLCNVPTAPAPVVEVVPVVAEATLATTPDPDYLLQKTPVVRATEVLPAIPDVKDIEGQKAEAPKQTIELKQNEIRLELPKGVTKIGAQKPVEPTASEILDAKSPKNETVAIELSPKSNAESDATDAEPEAEPKSESTDSGRDPTAPETRTHSFARTFSEQRAETNSLRPAEVREAILNHLEGIALKQNPNVTVEFESDQGVSSVDISHENGQVRMHFVTENQTVRAALESSKSDLDRSLRDSGYQGSQMSFDTGRQESKEATRPNRFHHFSNISEESTDAPARKSLWGLEILA
jgi:hypothetical protein